MAAGHPKTIDYKATSGYAVVQMKDLFLKRLSTTNQTKKKESLGKGVAGNTSNKTENCKKKGSKNNTRPSSSEN